MSKPETSNRRALAWGCLIMAAVVLLSVNVLSESLFQRAKIDLTEERLFTLSDGTRQVLGDIDEPIRVRLYFSSELGERVPLFQNYFERVRSVFEQYADLSGGKLELEVFDPEPFSDAEDRAVAAGLTGVPLGDAGVNGYFGYQATNSTDNEVVVPFVTLEREKFLEYDLSKMVYSLANPEKQVIGVISQLPMVGRYDMQRGGQTPDWQVIAQAREFFEVISLGTTVETIPDQVSILLVAQPVGLPDQLLYQIDQFALRGGKVVVFADPNAEIGRGQVPGFVGGDHDAGFERLLKAWGVVIAEASVVGDIDHGRRVQFGTASQPQVVDYVAWLNITQNTLDADDAVSGGIERLNFATAGSVAPIEGATTEFMPLVFTGPRAMQIPAATFTQNPNPVTLLEQYVPGGRPFALAARIVGETATAFPDGVPVAAAAEGEEAPEEDADAAADHIASGRIHAVVVTDVDFLFDALWVRVQDILGQRVAIPVANNGDFVLNVLDSISGGEVLIGLRGRGVDSRPFLLVDQLRQSSEERFREREQVLNAKVEELQGKLRNIERTADGGSVILTDEQREAIEKFRQELIAVRGQLREVKLALRQDIDRLDMVLKFANIAAVPIIVILIGLAVFAFRRSRQRGRMAAA